MNCLRAFVIGSSLPVSFPFLLFVAISKEKTFSYKEYSLAAPLFFGIANVLSLYIQKYFNLTRWGSLAVTSVISATIIVIRITINQAYTFESVWRWIMQYLILYCAHFYALAIAVYNIEKYF